MANKSLAGSNSQAALTAATSFASTDLLYGTVGGMSRSISGAVLASYISSAAILSGAGITAAAGKTLTVNNSLTLSGVDGKTLTINKNLTLGGADGKSLTLTNALTVSGNDGTLSFGAAGKTLTVNNSLTLSGVDGKTFTLNSTLTLAGTDGTTMTFPAASDIVAGLGTAQTFTAQNTFAAGTLTTSQPLQVTQTWNAGGVTFTGILENITNTASAAASLLMDLQVAAVSRFKVRASDGLTTVTTNDPNLQGYLVVGGTNKQVSLGAGNAAYPGVAIRSTDAYGWATGSDSTSGVYDTFISRGGAGVAQIGTTVSNALGSLNLVALTGTGAITAWSGTAIPAGGTTGSGVLLSSTANFGIFFGSAAPTLSAAKGSLYLRSDATTNVTRAYINTDGSTTWTAINTVG